MTGEREDIPIPSGPWGIWDQGILDLNGKVAHRFGGVDVTLSPVSSTPHAPLVGGTTRFLLSTPEALEVMTIGSNKRESIPRSKPAPWTTPTLYGEALFWVQIDEGISKIWWKENTEKPAQIFAEGSEHFTHVTGDKEWVAWRGDSEVFLRNWSTAQESRFGGQVHVNDRLALSNGLLCWEEWKEEDIDIHCSNGLHLEREGHQRSPSLWNGWLLFHEGRQSLLYGPLQYTPE